ncbi:hypothetical protein HanXRQr2_Chr16g0752661 [Helianthus annuus]|uniref:Uncharacterized protein n=1 Tax=Helianthus annuus TaxID=4232 RepID=A0A9K3DS02_HELAN|nr:hypothetical protein HanXRQr2_Chr16g0752661 [Helianthus annuus]KAJ0438428.1 hypothetical protein HanHA300_Chr16g0613941 [Helianthus annuus]KAJ0460752.1 hypothetical protein HanHA89_Chr16g0664521 [Helianthus annuus]KAJ0821538.1 hypothetical protein HanPSC8_Chr16g0721421 [Helianthus annuus]
MKKFLGDVLTKYGLHISQINALGLPRVTHFEFICQAQKLVPTVEMFNIFYYVTYIGGHYSFNSKIANVLPCSRDPPTSFHDWKNNFFYIRCGVISIDMHYRSEREGVLKFVIGGSYADRDWYKTLTRVPTAIVQLEEKALVAAGMSMMWDPRDPRAAPIYALRSKGTFCCWFFFFQGPNCLPVFVLVGYSLMNVLDLEVGGEMTTRILPEGERPWVDQIRDNFLHPSSSESLAAYVATALGARPPVNTEVSKSPTREEAIILSSEESTRSSHGLIYRSTLAGPRARPVQGSEGAAASTPPTAEPIVATSEPEHKEPEKKKPEKKESEKKELEQNYLLLMRKIKPLLPK